MRILVFDNYDSFTYNLVHLLQKMARGKVDVCLNDGISLEQVQAYDKIVLSPGPGIPREAGMLLPLIGEYAARKPMLGVCLGHQAIAEAFGAGLINLSTVHHGVSTRIFQGRVRRGDASSFLFDGLPAEITVGRYHSWIVDEGGFPDELEVTARDENGHIMAIQHKRFDIQGVQFHPESVLTPAGETILRNWLEH